MVTLKEVSRHCEKQPRLPEDQYPRDTDEGVLVPSRLPAPLSRVPAPTIIPRAAPGGAML